MRFLLPLMLTLTLPRVSSAQLVDAAASAAMNGAVAAADREVTIWFNLLRGDDPRAAWERGSPHFKERINRETFIRMWSGSVRSLEPVLKRRLTALRYVPADPPRFPEAVVFDTRVDFRGGTQGGETVTLARGDDGVWRVWEYLVSPTLRAANPGFSRPP